MSRTSLICIMFLILALNCMAISSYSQTVRMSMKIDNPNLKDAMMEIKKQTEFDFLYNKDIEALYVANTQINVEDGSIDDILNQLFMNSRIDYKIIDKTIVFMPRATENTVETQQGIPITGTVIDNEGQPLPGVSVTIKGTTQGTATNANGTFSLSVQNENAIISFSYIGFITQEITVGNKRIMNVTLVDDSRQLEEVVVVGYGTQKKATLTGSVTSVTGQTLKTAPIVNVSHSIAGQLPGVFVRTSSAEPGNDGSTIRIRGYNSLGSNDALIVVDGVPGRSLDRIDPNSIESIAVLKDASAAIYGAQAANGVILITTKRGSTGKPQITVNLNGGYSQPTVLPKMCNAFEYATALNEIDINRNSPPRYSADDLRKFADGSDPWRYPNTDWFAETLRTWAPQRDANIGLTGGNDFVKYFLSVGTKYQDAIYKDSGCNYTQHDFTSNLDFNFNKYIRLGVDLVGRFTDRVDVMTVNGAVDIWGYLFQGKPNTVAYWPNGLPGPDLAYGANPVVISTSQTGYDRNKYYTLNSKFNLDISIPWVEGLSLSGNAALDKTFNFRKQFQKPWYLYSWDGVTVDGTGTPVLLKTKKGIDDPRLTENYSESQMLLLNGLLRYERRIAQHHQVNFLVGIETIAGHNDYFSAYRRYFESDLIDQLNAGGTSQMSNSGSAGHSARLNYFGRVNYGFRDKYLMEFIWRVNGSYIFPKEGRYGFFPGISLGWRISEENFWKKNLSFINQFKIRASYGQTGSDSVDAYQYLTTYNFVTARQNLQAFNVNEDVKSLVEARIPNPFITWEVSNQADIGFDAQFLDNKISVTFDYFDYRRSNILIARNASIPRSTGLTLPRENLGKVSNHGYDFDVAYKDKAGNFIYQISVNGGYAKNKIVFWDEAPGVPDYQKSTGMPMNTALYYEAIGIFKDQAAVDAYPHWGGAQPGDIIYKDVNEDNKIDANDRVRHDKNDFPRFQGGLRLNLQYKQWYLTALFQGSAGSERLFLYQAGGEGGNYFKMDFDGRWTPENTDAKRPRLANSTAPYWMNNQSTYHVYHTNFIRLKSMEFGYYFPNKLLEKLGIKESRIYFSGLNLLTYYPSDINFMDPENLTMRAWVFPARVTNLGISVTF